MHLSYNFLIVTTYMNHVAQEFLEKKGLFLAVNTQEDFNDSWCNL